MTKHQPEPPPGLLSRFLTKGSSSSSHEHKTYPWYVVLWLTGVDYFSTLGYQPGIAFLAAGALSPIATALLVAVTLFGALPMYMQVADRSYEGQGSIAMLERLLPGWTGKLFVLALLGFAATGFVITMTLSAADAAVHAVENDFLHGLIGDHQMLVTLFLLGMLAVVFLMGFSEAVGVAFLIGAPYILLNVVVIGYGLVQVFQTEGAIEKWLSDPSIDVNWPSLLLASMIVFPKLALGLSGFETGVSVMPLVSGSDKPGEVPRSRIRNSKKLLAAAAVMMSFLLIGSSLVTTVLIEPEKFQPKIEARCAEYNPMTCSLKNPAIEAQEPGEANGRALAYLAEHFFGDVFGSIYDFVTIAILWFAGSSAMTGLLALIPKYLPRFGMAPRWVTYTRPLVLILFGITVLVTWLFDADVDAQAGAYATGVLVLMLSGAIAVSLALYRDSIPMAKDDHGRMVKKNEPRTGEQKKNLVKSCYFWFITAIFMYALVNNIYERPDGAYISIGFIVSIIVLSGISRWWRATELRVEQHEFADEESKRLFEEIRGKKINLVPLRTDATYNRRKKESEIRKYYKVDGPMAFLHIDLKRDRSDFSAPLKVGIRSEKYSQPEDENYSPHIAYVVNVSGAVAIANTIAYISEQLDPISLFLGLTRGNTMSQAFKYVLWGEGETGIMVYQILVRYWESTKEDDVRPLIFLISE